MPQRVVTATTPNEVLDATLGAITIGLVPVMGPFHDGHVALIARSDAENDDTVVVFFDPAGGLPDITQADVMKAHAAGARIFYRPEPGTITPHGWSTIVHVTGLTDRWEGATDPTLFGRVTTLYTILLNQLQPSRTYVGEKHYQQLVVLQRLREDLSLSGEIVAVPTLRDRDGLPLGSVNRALTANQRAMARAVPQALFAMQEAVHRGARDADTVVATGQAMLDAAPDIRVDYLALVHPATLEPVRRVANGTRAIIAVTIGEARLLDTVSFMTPEG